MSNELNYYLADVEELIPYARNARTHSSAQITQIAASIKEFGFLAPIVIADPASRNHTSPRRRNAHISSQTIS